MKLNTMRESVKSNTKLSLLAVCEFVDYFQPFGNLVEEIRCDLVG